MCCRTTWRYQKPPRNIEKDKYREERIPFCYKTKKTRKVVIEVIEPN